MSEAQLKCISHHLCYFHGVIPFLFTGSMLICPNCHSENPNRNNFCQKCGVSLTHHDCSECGTSVLWGDATCSNCGTVTGKVLKMVIRESVSEENAPSISAKFPSLYEDCVDIGHRYRLLTNEAFAPQTQDWGEKEVRVLVGNVIDCQPLQPSVLKVLLLNQGEFLAKLANLSEISEIEGDSAWKSLDLPKLVLPYFKFKDLTPKVPEIYDAWCEENSEVLLVADRNAWQSLGTALSEPSLPQLVYWFNEMVVLWRSLATLNYCQSLLVPDNVRVDEDQNLGLQLLYPDPVGVTPSLSDLGKQWQAWLTESSHFVSDGLKDLLAKLVEGEIQNPDELSLLLEAIAIEEENINFPEDFLGEDLPQFEELEVSGQLRGQGPPSTLPDANQGNIEELDDSPTAVLPMQLSDLADAAATDRGRQRPHNEDYFGLATQIQTKEDNQGKTVHVKGIYVVCDGMGGHAAGEVASQLAVNTLQKYFSQHWTDKLPDASMINEAILLANQTIFDINQTNDSAGSGRMGTTLIMALVQDTKIAIAHVGDSRIYRVTRRGGLEQLTVDHEVGQQAIQNGLDPTIAYARLDAYQLTQALGPHGSNFIQPDIRFFDAQEDTLLLLCSDGISDNNLVEENWENKLLPLISSTQSIDRGINKLIEFANEHNGHDNLTGILVRLKVRPQIQVNDW